MSVFRGAAWTVTKIVLTIGLFAWFISRTDFEGILGALGKISIQTLVVLSLLNFLGIFLSAYKWLILLPKARFKSLLASCFASYYYSILLPGQLAQEAAKAYHFQQDGSTSMHMIATSIAVDKIASVLGLLMVSVVGLIFSEQQLPQTLLWLFLVSGLVAAISLLLLRVDSAYFLTVRLFNHLTEKFPKGQKVINGILKAIDAWHGYARNLPMLSKNVLAAILYQLVGVYMFYLLSQELHLQIGYFDWCWIVGALTLALFLPLTIGGIGIREGTLIAILGMFGCSSEMAVAISLIAFGFVIMLALVGVVLLHRVSQPSQGQGT